MLERISGNEFLMKLPPPFKGFLKFAVHRILKGNNKNWDRTLAKTLAKNCIVVIVDIFLFPKTNYKA